MHLEPEELEVYLKDSFAFLSQCGDMEPIYPYYDDAGAYYADGKVSLSSEDSPF